MTSEQERCHCGADVVPGTTNCFIHGPKYPAHLLPSAKRVADENALPDWRKDTESGVILGQNIRSYPAVGGHCDVITVLVQGSINDYAAYSAGGRDPEWAKRHGGKISFEEACEHWPGGQLRKERYRT